MKYYAVARGYKPGIYTDWKSCSDQVMGYPNSSFKKFTNIEDAKRFIEENKQDVKIYNIYDNDEDSVDTNKDVLSKDENKKKNNEDEDFTVYEIEDILSKYKDSTIKNKYSSSALKNMYLKVYKTEPSSDSSKADIISKIRNFFSANDDEVEEEIDELDDIPFTFDDSEDDDIGVFLDNGISGTFTEKEIDEENEVIEIDEGLKEDTDKADGNIDDATVNTSKKYAIVSFDKYELNIKRIGVNTAKSMMRNINMKNLSIIEYETDYQLLSRLNKIINEKTDILQEADNKKTLLNKELKEKGYIENYKNLSDDEVIAYVDGSFNSNVNNYSYGVVLVNNKGEEILKSGLGPDEHKSKLLSMRNVSGELLAAMVAISVAIKMGYKRIYLHYDYKGIMEWAKGTWKAKKEGTRLYKSYINSIKDKIDMEFIKVKSHDGIKYNELADSIASDAFEVQLGRQEGKEILKTLR